MSTEITVQQLRQMPDGQFLDTLRRFPYASMWQDKDASAFAEAHLAHLNGRRYAKTGNPKSFTHSIR